MVRRREIIMDDKIQGFLTAIARDQKDDTLRQVFADYLEEQGDERAKIVRKMYNVNLTECRSPGKIMCDCWSNDKCPKGKSGTELRCTVWELFDVYYCHFCDGKGGLNNSLTCTHCNGNGFVEKGVAHI